MSTNKLNRKVMVEEVKNLASFFVGLEYLICELLNLVKIIKGNYYL